MDFKSKYTTVDLKDKDAAESNKIVVDVATYALCEVLSDLINQLRQLTYK